MIRVLFVCPYWKKEHTPDGVPLCVKQQAKSLNETGEVHVQIQTIKTGSNPINYFLAWARFHLHSQIINMYDLVHCHWGYLPLVVFPSDKPVIVTLRGGDVYEHQDSRPVVRYRECLASIMTKYCARRVNRVIAVSKHLGMQLGGLPFELMPNGVDLSRFSRMDQRLARQALGLSTQRKIVLFGADPENRVKNFALAQKVCHLSTHKPMLVTLSGVPHKKVAVYMNACDALLVTSYREGSPNVVKEALSCGLPVLSVDVGDIAERTHAIIGCKMARSYDPDHLAHELDGVLSSSQRLPATIANLDQEDVARGLVSVYKSTLAN